MVLAATLSCDPCSDFVDLSLCEAQRELGFEHSNLGLPIGIPPRTNWFDEHMPYFRGTPHIKSHQWGNRLLGLAVHASKVLGERFGGGLLSGYPHYPQRKLKIITLLSPTLLIFNFRQERFENWAPMNVGNHVEFVHYDHS